MLRYTALCLFVFLSTNQLSGFSAEVPDGTWKWTNEMQGRAINSTLTLKSDGDKLSGTYSNETFSSDIENASMKGGALEFDVKLERPNGTLKVHFAGKLSGSQLSGSIDIYVDGEQRRSGVEWSAERHVGNAEVVGTWDFKFTSPDGIERTSALEITENDGKLTGSLEDDREQIAELEEIRLTKDGFEFKFSTEHEGNQVDLHYMCKPKGNQLTGLLGYEVAGESGEFPIAAKRRTVSKELARWIGDWEFSMTGPDGVERKSLLRLAESTGKLSVDLSAEGRTFDVDGVKLKDGELSFDFSNAHDGVEVALMWICKLDGNNSMSGTLSFDTGSNSGEIPISGERKD